MEGCVSAVSGRNMGEGRRAGWAGLGLPMKKRFRQGRRRAFHLYHACAMGPMRFRDMDGAAVAVPCGGVGGRWR